MSRAGRRVGHQDVWAGILFAAVGGGALIVGRNYAAGTAFQMGPGYVPRVIGILLIVIGVVTALVGLARPSQPVTGPREPRGAIVARALRPLATILGAMTAFAVAIETVGLPAAVAIAVLVGGYADRAARVRELVMLAAALAIFAVAVFVFALDLPIPVLPR